MSARQAKLIFALALGVQGVLWSQSRYGTSLKPRPGFATSLLDSAGLTRRGLYAPGNDTITMLTEGEPKCKPLSFPISNQCAHVRDVCPTSETFLHIPYIQRYFCTPESWRPTLFVGLVLWLSFLFSTLGISAADFFCPNLATIAQVLGLDENVAGVTFLAFGNGSPDVFATFSSMRADSAGLAIGELLGAASFIVSVVVGSMCIIKPFRADPWPFLRDVGFFTLAVSLLLGTLWDGKIEMWEAGGLVVVYAVYVTVVVVGTWWMKRRALRRSREALVRSEYAEEEIPQIAFHDEEYGYRDEPLAPSNSLVIPSSPSGRLRAASQPSPPSLSIRPDLPPRPHSRESSHAETPRLGQMTSFSLVGALEFRHLVSSLQPHASASSLSSLFDSPVTPYAGGHYHTRTRSHSRTPGHPGRTDSERDPWDAALAESTGSVRLQPRPSSPNVASHGGTPNGHGSLLLPIHDSEQELTPVSASPPAMSPTSTTAATDPEARKGASASKRQRARRALRSACHVLFPTLLEFRSKSALGKFMALFAAPAVLLLTLTLPVVVSPHVHQHGSFKSSPGADGHLLDFEEEGYERALVAEEEVQEEMHGLAFNKWLMAAQCVCGPLFVVSVLFDGATHEGYLLFAVGAAGLALAAVVAVLAGKNEHPTVRMVRCAMGFMVAVVWIMAIADEVVSVLQTFGFIFGLSNAIIGLTIFAMGNSVADLVANTSVAAFAPIMGFSACFGGPMLNILLGIGISGSYMIAQTERPYELDFSDTLISSALGLLALLVMTAVVVPLNGYELTRRWGVVLIATYSVIMAINIWVELRW
ncbi:hypothetical protein PUNSTDRAFT_146140 [Punctularia strigosozonata HHB-11173 SS5]|uniref:Sodium/calcium exchanger membrane region domain-containing protein n=1 Tax=Punctularia strigosozonata (strain HHB-11173) TaxID=741275 RepID=R7S3M8_PUNST|nr:uncharacterized protein PUNSTDRAFT_146140 [Punctularia strigosozonata HHB-11173 SS5]EIN04803.1 hypothetical protein PUNSTDRAFT_146140 [Punctularia strigosozonata HHB-11173 SS5]